MLSVESVGCCIPMRFLNRRLKRARPLLGTYVEIEIVARTSEAQINKWINAGFQAISEIDQLMSFHRVGSDLTRLNRSKAGVWISVHHQTRRVLETANDIFSASRGVFDVRCGAVLVACGLLPKAPDQPMGPCDGELAAPPVKFKSGRVCKSGPWTMDLGGIAKGYAVDQALLKITKHASDLERVIVNAGGDLRMWGEGPVSCAMRIEGPAFPYLKPFDIGRSAAATSSLQTRSNHVKMPVGTIVQKGQTATVFSDECLIADALTKVVLLGPAEVASACLARYRAQALVFRSDGRFERTMPS